MKKFIKKILPPILIDFYKKMRSIRKSESQKNIDRWRKIDGDNTLRLDYPQLNEQSLVFDIGGYKGEWSKNIFARYSPTTYIFEPVPSFFYKIEKFYAHNKKIVPFKFGFGADDVLLKIALSDDASSIYSNRKNVLHEQIRIRKLSDFIKENNIQCIDLIKINIEGSEYDVIYDLHENNLLDRIMKFQIQFHEINPQSKQNLKNCRDILAKTHSQDWCFDFVWEAWTYKGTYANSSY